MIYDYICFEMYVVIDDFSHVWGLSYYAAMQIVVYTNYSISV